MAKLCFHLSLSVFHFTQVMRGEKGRRWKCFLLLNALLPLAKEARKKFWSVWIVWTWSHETEYGETKKFRPVEDESQRWNGKAESLEYLSRGQWEGERERGRETERKKRRMGSRGKKVRGGVTSHKNLKMHQEPLKVRFKEQSRNK